MKRISFVLFAILVALILGAKDVIVWEWQHASADLQIKAVAIGIMLGIWALHPAFKHLM